MFKLSFHSRCFQSKQKGFYLMSPKSLSRTSVTSLSLFRVQRLKKHFKQQLQSSAASEEQNLLSFFCHLFQISACVSQRGPSNDVLWIDLVLKFCLELMTFEIITSCCCLDTLATNRIFNVEYQCKWFFMQLFSQTIQWIGPFGHRL